MAVRAATAPAAADEQAGPPSAEPRWSRGLALVATAVACLPVLLAVVWAIRIGWWPAADDALIAFRSLDVFSTNTPLVGMPSTVGTTGHAVGYHLGPMVFWVLAIPVRVFGGIGLAFGAAAVNLASLVTIAWLCRRRGGTGLLVVAMAVVGVLAASLGRDLLISPWNPHIALLPMMLMFVAAWFTAEGRAWAVPALAVSASFVAQAHLGYVGIAVLVTLWAVACHAWRLWRARRGDGDLRLGAPHLAALAIVAVCWAPVLWQQVTSHPGNLTLVVRSIRHPEDEPRGNEFATDAVTRSISVVPLWARGPLDGSEILAVYQKPEADQTATAAVAVVVLAGLGVALWRRRGDRAAPTVALTGIVVLASAWFTAGRLPEGPASLYRIRWLWPVSAFVWLAVAAAIVALVVGRRRWTAPRPLLTLVVVGALVFAVVAYRADPGSTEAQDTTTLDAIDELADDAVPVVASGTWLVRAAGNEAFLGSRTGLVWRLRERGYDIRMPSGEDNARARLGPDLTTTPDKADGILLLSSGQSAYEDHGRLLGTADASPHGRRKELRATRKEALDLLRRERPTLTPAGERFLRSDKTGQVQRDLDELQALLDRDPAEFLRSRFVGWVGLGLLELHSGDPDFVRRLADYGRYHVERQFRLEVLPSR